MDHYNNFRLNSATGYITPKDLLAGRQQEINAERDRRLEAARQQWQCRRQQAAVKAKRPSLRAAAFSFQKKQHVLVLDRSGS